jgi:hypothetical protein
MENELTNEMIDKIMFRYFDSIFKDSIYRESVKLKDSSEKWSGFFIGREVLLGHPHLDDSLWFSHGPILGDANAILDITQKEYHQSMARYINKRYPEVKKIHNIM